MIGRKSVKALKTIGLVGMAAALSLGLTACGGGYNGEGTVISKENDKDTNTKMVNGKKKKTTRDDYEVMVDLKDSAENMDFDVSKSVYDRLQPGQKVIIKNGQIQ